MNGSKHTPLSPDELSVFCYQLSLMVQAGIGSEESVGILADDARNPREQALLRQIHKVLMEGESLSKALESTGVFPNYLLRMVEIGQISGRLEQVLSALSTFYRRESALRQSLRRAVAYPAAMAVLIAVVFLALVSQVLPVFEQVFRQLGVSMSPVARGLMAFGDVSKYVAAVFAVVLILAAGYLLWLFRSQKGQAAMSRLLSHTGPSQAVDRSRFSAAMALASSTGIRRLRRIHGWVWTSRLLGLPKWTRVFSTTSVTISPRTAWPFSTVGSNHVYRQPSPSTAALRRNSRTSPTT